jgi:cytochrome b561
MPTSAGSPVHLAMPVQRWSPHIVLIHWVTVLILTVGVAAVLWRDAVDGRVLRALLLQVHQHAGLMVLGLTLVRLVTRALGEARPRLMPTWGWQRVAALVVHGLFYLALPVLPLVGWALTNARGQPMNAFGVLWPALCSADPDQADVLEQAHAMLAWSLLVLIAVHAAAAVWHHWVRRDDVLRAMTPFPPRPPKGIR